MHARRRLALVLLTVTVPALASVGSDRVVPELPRPGERIRVIVDTDAACEIDDLYAIALALLCPDRFEIEGFVAAHFGDSGGPDGPARSVKAIQSVLEHAGAVGQVPRKTRFRPTAI